MMAMATTSGLFSGGGSFEGGDREDDDDDDDGCNARWASSAGGAGDSPGMPMCVGASTVAQVRA